ncbi:MAG TPA: glucosidase [Thermoanaerobaculia bacterium]|nr:glucosidase [Thermoanaerobaculia bacterium]
MAAKSDPEAQRLLEDSRRQKNWKRWGPYLAERAWGTVREDYSADGSAWTYFPHEHARSRAYRWGEDGLAGISDRHQFVCFALALWNGRDPILKERLFGLSGPEGNHGEDVKESYFYLDSTPTHSYMKCLYKYPQREFPYARLLEENARRSRRDPEFELDDTGVFADDRYFDVFVEYAKATPDDILVRVAAFNRGPEAARLHLLPTIWFRNLWSWGLGLRRPRLRAGESPAGGRVIELESEYYGRRRLHAEGSPELLFTENESNGERLWGVPNDSPHVKDSFHTYVIEGRREAVNPDRRGSKAACLYVLDVPPGGSASIRLRLTDDVAAAPFGDDFERIFTQRLAEADGFAEGLAPASATADGRLVMRQATAGLLWSKQYYHYDVARWLKGDPGGSAPPPRRLDGRNHEWTHVYNADVISMPDKWEYPWYAAWDLAFHCVALAVVDPDAAKQQLVLLLREWYMHPNGQLPAYEWAFGDVNPPVHAWAAWRVYKIERKRCGSGDRNFLERVFHKLLLNFTWWVNRKDTEGNNVFEGGFLGLDNIGVFDRSAPLPTGGTIQQSDATSWMGMFCLNMLAIALELAEEDRAYEDVASKFFEHFVYICRAMNSMGGRGIELWDAKDGFYYDVLLLPDGRQMPMKIRSMVGLVPLFAVETLESRIVDKMPGFKKRMQWFLENRPELADYVETQTAAGNRVRRRLSLVNRMRLTSILRYMLDEAEFLSPHGVRALSRYHRDHPYRIVVGDQEYRVDYEPGESATGLFGGNSNWRGPVWFPVNYLIIESLQKFHYFFGDSFQVEFPTGSGKKRHLWDVAAGISRRLSRIFLRDASGRRPVFGAVEKFQTDPHFRDVIPFFEYFHGDTGAGLGASHQTGWTALVVKLLQQSGERSPA